MPEQTQQHPVPSVRAIIVNENNEVLIVRRASTKYGNGQWCLPGGKIDFGTTAEESVIREIKEETNLNCTKAQFLFYLDGLPTEEYTMHCPTLFFNCDVKGKIQLNDESDQYVWVDGSNCSNYKIAFANDTAIERFYDLKMTA